MRSVICILLDIGSLSTYKCLFPILPSPFKKNLNKEGPLPRHLSSFIDGVFVLYVGQRVYAGDVWRSEDKLVTSVSFLLSCVCRSNSGYHAYITSTVIHWPTSLAHVFRSTRMSLRPSAMFLCSLVCLRQVFIMQP